MRPVLRYNKAICAFCGACAGVCPAGVHQFNSEVHTMNRSNCNNCGACATACPTGALHMSSREYSVDELMEELLQDRDFYQTSDGGITFSGGDAMLQTDFLAEALRQCKQHGIHTAVDTAGNVGFERFEKVLPYVDLFLYDVKLFSEKHHSDYTGASNLRILENLKRLAAQGASIWVRVPLIPGVHDDGELRKMADFLRNIPVERVELLAYHRYGIGKYAELGEAYTLDTNEPDTDWMKSKADLFHSAGVTAVIG